MVISGMCIFFLDIVYVRSDVFPTLDRLHAVVHVFIFFLCLLYFMNTDDQRNPTPAPLLSRRVRRLQQHPHESRCSFPSSSPSYSVVVVAVFHAHPRDLIAGEVPVHVSMHPKPLPKLPTQPALLVVSNQRSNTDAWTPELPCSDSPHCFPALPRRSSPAQHRRAALPRVLLRRSLLPRAAPLPPCLPPKSSLFHTQNRFFFLPLRLLLARGDDTSSSLPPTPEETRGKQQCLALRRRDLGCAWAYAPVAASAVRRSAKEEEGDSVRRQGALGMLLESLLLGPLITSLLKKENNMTSHNTCLRRKIEFSTEASSANSDS
ncbi:uncharacterized protein [Aegilops tauschii subsp. strangulata]|uniref:uncharacterized protein n=1 Tax=Aegilops tauschii subsp. strangulata TaxID=200361 RepID=UPI003CC86C7E